MGLATRLSKVRLVIELACKRAGRTSSVRILAATKGQSQKEIVDLVGLGITLIGENRYQEAKEKFALLDIPVERHFIGTLQKNKVKGVVSLFDCIQSVDSFSLAEEISKRATKPYPVFLEVNIASEKTKQGVSLGKAQELFDKIRKLPNIRVVGLMGMAPFGKPEYARPHFRALRKLQMELDLPEISIGMSNDYIIAVEEGSTLVRLGTALFGER